MWPFEVTVVTGGYRVIMSVDKPGRDTQPLLMARENVAMEGEQKAA